MSATPHAQVDAIVIGAGFAGLYMLKRLLDLGMTIQGFEAAGGVGGTWYWNRYPGARCDLESFDYSYSFSPELEQEWEWSERYPSQPELLRYFEHVADRFDLRRFIRFNTRVVSAAFDDITCRWTVATDAGTSCIAQYLITAVGVLSTPKPPEIPGLASFAGRQFHTGQWPHEGVDFTGRRVGVIGTGSSGVQSIPIIAAQASQLMVFQRTPNYSVPSLNYPLTAEQQDEVKRSYRERRAKARQTRYGIPASFPTAKAMDATPEERLRTYNKAWDESHLLAFRMTYADILVDERANQTIAAFLADKIKGIVKDPVIAETLVPKSFPFGTKRPCLGTKYYETFNHDNVTLVDLQQTPIRAITATGVLTTENAYELDDLVYATGFDALTGALLRIDIRGIGGRRLSGKWQEGPRAYLGLCSAGFPNLFFLTGPGSPGPLSNMAVSIEQHVEWVGHCLKHMQTHSLGRIEAEEAAESAWVDHVQEVVQGTLYLKANSWYVGANVPGKPKVFIPYLGGADVYRARCDAVVASGYLGFAMSAGAQPERGPIVASIGA
jgi:cyclohexanone monooxygenase